MGSSKNIKNIVVAKEQTTSKLFKYSKGAINISFNIRVDIKQEMKDLVDCLETALVEIKGELQEK